MQVLTLYAHSWFTKENKQTKKKQTTNNQTISVE
jgi:hypothetical protein